MKSPLNNTVSRGLINPNHTSTLQIVYTADSYPSPWPWVLLSMLLSMLLSSISVWTSWKKSNYNSHHPEPDTAEEPAAPRFRKVWTALAAVGWLFTTIRTYSAFIAAVRSSRSWQSGLSNAVFVMSISVSIVNYSLPPLANYITLLNSFVVITATLLSILRTRNNARIIGGHCPSLVFAHPTQVPPDRVVQFMQDPPPIRGLNCTELAQQWQQSSINTGTHGQINNSVVATETFAIAFVFLYYIILAVVVIGVGLETDSLTLFMMDPRTIRDRPPLSIRTLGTLAALLLKPIDDFRSQKARTGFFFFQAVAFANMIILVCSAIPSYMSVQINRGQVLVFADAAPDESWWDYFLVSAPTDPWGFFEFWWKNTELKVLHVLALT